MFVIAYTTVHNDDDHDVFIAGGHTGSKQVSDLFLLNIFC